MNILLLLWLLTGGGISTAVMMHFWLPDPPPPDVFSRFIKIVFAGAIGGLAAGYLINSQFAESNPMPSIIAAVGGGLILSGVAAALSSGRK